MVAYLGKFPLQRVPVGVIRKPESCATLAQGLSYSGLEGHGEKNEQSRTKFKRFFSTKSDHPVRCVGYNRR